MTGSHEGFWGYIHALYERVASASPSGTYAVVEIETSDSRTFEPKAVQVYGPFLVCEIAEEATEVLVVRESDVRRIRIFQAAEDENVPVGFRVGEIELG